MPSVNNTARINMLFEHYRKVEIVNTLLFVASSVANNLVTVYEPNNFK